MKKYFVELKKPYTIKIKEKLEEQGVYITYIDEFLENWVTVITSKTVEEMQSLEDVQKVEIPKLGSVWI